MAAVDELLGFPAYALVRLRGSADVLLLGGTREDFDLLSDVPLEQGPPPAGRPRSGQPRSDQHWDRLLCVPFRQIRERGYDVHDDGAPLSAIAIEHERAVPVDVLLAELPDEPVTTDGSGGFDTSDEEYGRVVEAIIRDEIGTGQGANLVVGRNYRTRLADWDHRKALSVFRRLVERERGAYWTFCVFTGDRWLIGASPERHVSVHGGDVRMNPISGTFRLPRGDRGPSHVTELKEQLLGFLADEKEIYELFMVVDEELKMMCDICSEGGQVLGPYLKPMTHLIHTEYLLAGRSHHDVRDVLRDSMFAATVTGSPVENACRLIKTYEPEGRGYYASVLALLGRDREGAPTADAPILIRTGDVSLDGALKVTAGATLVRDSDPAYETAETHAKAGGILNAFGLVDAPTQTRAGVRDLVVDEDVLIALASRNQRLSRFLMTDQSDTGAVPDLVGRTAVVLDGEDDFINMLRHVLTVMGVKVSVVRHDAWRPGSLDGFDLVVVGPGPGDPRDGDHPRIAVLREAVRGLLASGQRFLAVCLGHQVLCGELGLPLHYKDIVFQGTQTKVQVLGREENVGFYNTFVCRVDDDSVLPSGVHVDRDRRTGDVHAISGPHYRGIQFHAESILSENGYAIVRDLVLGLFG
ncbi:MAG TPA: anthranilate synthase family protein [Nocardioidaceae bacterium]|nr:anthranilate synthase family protein [Nocardioidaceae bacterium]